MYAPADYHRLLQENADLRERLEENEAILSAIKSGQVDALIATTPTGNQIFTLQSADFPYRVLIEEMPDGALTITKTGTILYCNPSFAQMVMRPVEKVPATAILDFFPNRERNDFLAFLASVSEDNKSSREFNLLLPQGSLLPTHISASAMRFGDEDLICLVVVDISVEKQREEELRLLQTLGFAIGQAQTLNDALLQVMQLIGEKTEWEIGEIWMPLAGKLHRVTSWHTNTPAAMEFDRLSNHMEMLPEEGLQGGVWSQRQSLWFPEITEQPEFSRAEIARRLGLKSGLGVPVLADERMVAVILFFTLKPREKDQHFIRMISSVASHLGTYITRKQTDERMWYQARLLETVQDPIISTDIKGMIVSWNRAAEALYGWNAEEVIGKNYNSVFSPHFVQDSPSSIISKLLEQGTWIGEVIHRTRDGALVHTLSAANVIRDVDGVVTAIVGSHRDITEQKRAILALQASESKFRSLFENAPISMWEEDFSEIKTHLLQLRERGIDDLEAYFRKHPELFEICVSLGKVIDVNTASVRLYEARDKADLMDQLRRFVPPESDLDNLGSLLAMANGEITYTMEILNYTVNRRPINLALTWSALPGYEETLAKVIVCAVDITPLKNAIRELEESKRFAQATVNALSDVIAILDENGTVIEVNHAWRSFGRANGVPSTYHWEGVNYLEVCDKAGDIDDAQIVAMGIRSVINGRQSHFVHEYPCFAPREKRWYTVRITPFAGSGPVRVVVAHEDVTERKIAENALRQANEQLTVLNRVISLANASLEPSNVLDTLCRELANVFRASHVIAALLNDEGNALRLASEYSREERPVISRHTIPTSEIPLVEELMQRKAPFTIANADLDTRLGDLNSQLMADVGAVLVIPLIIREEVVGLVVVCTFDRMAYSNLEVSLGATISQAASQSLENSFLHMNIADQNTRLEHTVEERTAQLKLLNNQMATVLDNTSDAIILTRGDGVIENVNLAFHNLFEYAEGEMLGKPIHQLVHPVFKEQTLGALRRLHQSSPIEQFQLMLVRKDNSTFEADCSLAFVGDQESHVVWSIRDITHLKEIERMKDQFVSMVSHELRTPVASMVMSASSLQRYYDRMHDQQRLATIERLNEQANLMAELIEGILDLSRIDARSIVPAHDPVDMYEIVNKVITELQGSIAAKGHTLVKNLDAPHTVVMGSSVDYARIWRNLISNAIKYTEQGGTVTLNLGVLTVHQPNEHAMAGHIDLDRFSLPGDFAPGDYLVGQVKDNGSGISEEDLKHLFTRFFRGQASQSSVPGTGLGLALVRELLNLYGGGISVSSVVGEGSVFSFWVPITS